MLTAQTLIKYWLVVKLYSCCTKNVGGRAAEKRKGSTDKVAIPKMTVKRVFCNFDVLSRQRNGIGFFDVIRNYQ